MLQQTTVPAVVPRWEAFMARFPDVHALAGSQQSDVLAEWSGLGYYRRARMLHCAAQEVESRWQGRLPKSLEDWRSLPGVGAYAAGAIASIGLGLPVAAVDANVRRVMIRWTFDDPLQANRIRDRRLHEIASAHVPADRPGDWNQALMDLGSSLCRGDRPPCSGCPVRPWCAASLGGTTAEIPPARVRPERVDVDLGVLVARHGDEVLLLPSEEAVVASVSGLGRPIRRSLAGMLSGTLCLPMTPWYASPETPGVDPFLPAWRTWLSRRELEVLALAVAPPIRHTITCHRMQVHVLVADLGMVGRSGVEGAQWRRAGDPDVALATLMHRALDSATGTPCR